MAASTPSPHNGSLLMSLPRSLLETIVEHVCPYAKPVLLCTCKTLRQAVLQQAPRITLEVSKLGSDRSWGEARAVIRRQQQIGTFTLDSGGIGDFDISELAPPSSDAQAPCAVSCLVLHYGVYNLRGAGAAFPTLKSLRMSDMCLNVSDLQGLAQCSGLQELYARSALLDRGVTPEVLRSCLPAVHRVCISGSHECWISALAPQLTHLEVVPGECARTIWEEEEEDWHGVLQPSSLAALSSCTQLASFYIGTLTSEVLEVLLGLPSLREVACGMLQADVGRRSCSWSELRCTDLWLPEDVGGLPLGIHTLRIEGLTAHTEATPEGSLQVTQAAVGTLMAACQQLALCGGPPSMEPCLEVVVRDVPPCMATPCIVETLKGLSPLSPLLTMLIVSGLQLPLDLAFVSALSTFTQHLHIFKLRCTTVAADAWAALPAAMPSLSLCNVLLDRLTEGSVAALGALCRDPGTPKPALRKVSVEVINPPPGTACAHNQRTRALLGRLEAELEASRAPVAMSYKCRV